MNVSPSLAPLQYGSSILTSSPGTSAGTLSCLPRLLPLIFYLPPTARHLLAGLHGRKKLSCLQDTCTTAHVSLTIAAVLHGQYIESTHSIQ